MDAAADAEDARWMCRALALAERGWGRTAPNPMVGCVLVAGGRAVGEGWHAEYGAAHAEVEALAAAGGAARGATAYVSLEPCAHHGKTPPCTGALIAAGVRRVVFGAPDPNPEAAGGGEVLRAAGVEVAGGVEAAAARDLDPAFFHAHGPSGAERPFVALKLALSLDACVADRDGRSVWITGEAARDEVHRLRAGFDAVAVGAGTAAADDPLLTVRGTLVPRVAPARVVFDRGLRLSPASRLVRTAAETSVVVVCEPDAPEARRAPLEAAGVRVVAGAGLAGALRALRESGIGSIFVEGGAVLASALLAADAVDRAYLFYAPVFLGADGVRAFAGVPGLPLPDARRWRRLDTRVFGSDTLVTLARG
jgi:diaminohydroxyphosphoribosylaminopyrimidine deaminase / 5-amino-6-(5-phosphoribosylamino)uracil reductase